MEREYKEITTPVSGQKLKLKSWLTGRERREIKAILLQDVKIEASEKSESGNETEKTTASYAVGGGVLQRMQDKAFETVIVSIDGSPEDVVNKVLDMREQDFNFVVKEIDAVTSAVSDEVKKK